MSKALAKLLNRPEEEIFSAVSKLEVANGHPSHDLHLLSDVIAATKQKIADLKLDPEDTTAQELYCSLAIKYQADCRRLDRILGIGPAASLSQRLYHAIDLVKAAASRKEVWSIKPSLAKQLLRQHSPKRLTKILGYRSVDSMLKRENTGGLYLISRYLESPSWQAKFSRAVNNLSGSNYSLGKLNFVELPIDKLGGLSGPPELYVCHVQTASLAVWPSNKTVSASVLSLALLLAQAADELGAAVNLKQLLAIDTSLAWWADAVHVISTHDTPISFNIHDVAANHHAGTGHHESSVTEAAKKLWTELQGRYETAGEDLISAAKNSASNLLPAELAAEYQEA